MRVDYTNAKTAPVLVCFVHYKDKFLLLKRSDKVLAYKNLWSTVAGFIDDKQSLEEKVVEEITEELGLKKDDIKTIKQGEVYTFKDKDIGRDWVRHLFLVEIASPKIKLDEEHTDYRWIVPEEIDGYHTTPGFAGDLEKIKKLL